MDRNQLVAFGAKRYGQFWIGLLADEIGYDNSTLWRMAKGQIGISEHVRGLIAALPPSPAPKISSLGNPWMVIPGLNDEFEAAADGRVRRVKFKGCPYRGRVLKPSLDRNGYPKVAVHVAGKRKWIPVHRLIAVTFLGPRPPGLQIDHIDGDKTNNAASNLEYVTGSENMRRAFRLGLVKPIPQRARRLKPMADALWHILNDPASQLSDKSKQLAVDALSVF